MKSSSGQAYLENGCGIRDKTADRLNGKRGVPGFCTFQSGNGGAWKKKTWEEKTRDHPAQYQFSPNFVIL
jgi:hypothetical protein